MIVSIPLLHIWLSHSLNEHQEHIDKSMILQSLKRNSLRRANDEGLASLFLNLQVTDISEDQLDRGRVCAGQS